MVILSTCQITDTSAVGTQPTTSCTSAAVTVCPPGGEALTNTHAVEPQSTIRELRNASTAKSKIKNPLRARVLCGGL